MAALLKKSREEIHWTDPHFHRQVLEEGKRMAQMYPGYRTEDSADAGRGRFHEQDSRTVGAGGSDGEVSLSGNLPETRRERKSSGGE